MVELGYPRELSDNESDQTGQIV